jgi:hypothetical protein
MPKNFATQQDFLLAVEESLHPSEYPPEIREALIHGVTQGDNALAQWEEQDNPGQELRLGRWFIRNDDFPFFQLLGAVAAGLVVLAATSGVAASALVAPIANLAAACWQVKRKGATLTPEQVAALGILNVHQGATVEQIANKLAATGRTVSEKEVLVTLRSLASLELYDGSTVAIVRCDDGDKWRALRV